MPATYRTLLAEVLSRIDQLLAEAEEIDLNPCGDEQDAATEFFVKLQQIRRDVEAMLRGE